MSVHTKECAADPDPSVCRCGNEAFSQLVRLEGECPSDPNMALVHVRAMYDRLSELATVAADQRWPGFEALMNRLVALENRLVRRLSVRA